MLRAPGLSAGRRYPLKMGAEELDQVLWRVLLNKVSGAWQDLQSCQVDVPGELTASRDRDPGIVRAPDHERWSCNLAVARLDLKRVPLVTVRYLAVERGLSGRGQPRRNERLFNLAPQRARLRCPGVRAHDCRVNLARQLLEHLEVVLNEPVERRPPASARDDVDRRERADRSVVQEMRAQRDRAADVVRDHTWALEAPVVE